MKQCYRNWKSYSF